MSEVSPIKKVEDIRLIYKLMKKWNKNQEAEAFLIGCNSALRCGDLMNITMDQARGGGVNIKEQKTGKRKLFKFNQDCLEAIDRLLSYYNDKGLEPVYLFQALGNRAKGMNKPFSVDYIRKILKQAAEAACIDYNVGSHTMRKSFAYHAYKNGADIFQLQALLNHNSIKDTFKYIGVTQERVQNLYKDYAISIA